MDKRTDLALEILPEEEVPEGVRIHRRGSAFSITDITIETDDHRETIGKGKGRYITLESRFLNRFSR